jgi:hypothetical protein
MTQAICRLGGWPEGEELVMTEPAAETIERETTKLWVTDAELIGRMGVPEKIARAALHVLDRERRSGFPPKMPLWRNRRYWPSVVGYFDDLYGHKPRSAGYSNAAARATTLPPIKSTT